MIAADSLLLHPMIAHDHECTQIQTMYITEIQAQTGTLQRLFTYI